MIILPDCRTAMFGDDVRVEDIPGIARAAAIRSSRIVSTTVATVA